MLINRAYRLTTSLSSVLWSKYNVFKYKLNINIKITIFITKPKPQLHLLFAQAAGWWTDSDFRGQHFLPQEDPFSPKTMEL